MNPSFDQQHLRLFVALARHLSMRRAAGELRLTASGISRSLAMLERSWGCRLFDRTPRRMALTRVGCELLPLAEAALERLGALQAGLPNDSDPTQQHDRELRIGASAALGQRVLPAVLREFRDTCPRCWVRIVASDGPPALHGLRDGRLDLVVTLRPAALDGLAFDELAEDDLHFVLHPLHPWAVERRVNLEEMGERRLILPGAEDETGAMVRRYFQEDRIEIKPCIETADEESIKQFVRHDLGVAVLPRWIVAGELARGELTTLPLGRRRLRRQWGVLHRRGHALDFAEHLFTSVCGVVLRDRLELATPPAPATDAVPPQPLNGGIPVSERGPKPIAVPANTEFR